MREFLIFEDVATAPRIHLFRALGVQWSCTPMAWLILPAFLPLGIVAALVWLDGPIERHLLIGLVAGLGTLGAMVVHELGHVISARLVGGPMDEALFVAVRGVTLYRDAVDPPSRIHVGRTVGGPALNLIVGALLALVSTLPESTGWAFVLGWSGLVSAAFGLISLLPLPSFDGAVLLRELWR